MHLNRKLAALAGGLAAIALLAAGCSKATTDELPTPDPTEFPVSVQAGDLYTLSSEGVERVKFLLSSGHNPPGLNRLLDDADGALGHPLTSVADKKESTLPKGATKHDFVTFARYYWPDPKNPNGPYKPVDGKVITDQTPDYANFKALTHDVRVLGLAYKVTGNKQYADKAAAMIRMWFLAPGTRMNPNVNFGQVIRNTNRPTRGAIEMYNISMVLDGITLIRDSGALNVSERLQLKAWFIQYLQWLTADPHGMAEWEEFKNNRLTWYYAQVIAVAMFVGNHDLALQTAKLGTQLVDNQVAGDGNLPLENQRADATAYNFYGLLALLRLGWAVNNVPGAPKLLDFKGGDGAGIRKAVMTQVVKTGTVDKPPALRMGAYIYDGSGMLAQLAFAEEPNTDSATVVGFPLSIGE